MALLKLSPSRRPGLLTVHEKIQDVFMVIDFSSNRFEGESSKLVGSLKGLLLLNVSKK
jgi:hypothetical protein